jgi:hypothetical protein
VSIKRVLSLDEDHGTLRQQNILNASITARRGRYDDAMQRGNYFTRFARRFSAILIGAALFAGFAAQTGRAGVITPLPPNTRVSDANVPSVSDATLPDIVVRGDTLYATWLDERKGYSHPDVYFAKSTDGGTTWSANTAVSERPYDNWPDDPSIAVQPDGTIWVSWYLFYTDNSDKVNDVRLARSTDGGATWQRYTAVNGVPDNEDLWQPKLAVDASRVYVLYHLVGNDGYVMRLKIIDAQNPASISTTNVSETTDPGRINGGLLDNGPLMSLAWRDGKLCAAWEDRRDTFAIYGTCSTDNGATFPASKPFSGANAVRPEIALAPDGALYLAYSSDSDDRRNILVRRSGDNGATWSQPVALTNHESPSKSGTWDVAVDETGQVLIGWIRVNLNSNDVFLSTSVDRGSTFSFNTLEDGQGQFPTVSDPSNVRLVAAGDGANARAHVIWEDDRNVRDEIWAVRAPLDGTPPTAPPNFRARGEEASILLSWEPASDANGLAGYRVFRAANAAGPFTRISPFGMRSTFFRDVELAPGATYFYTVVAVDSTGNAGPPSGPISAAALANGAPAFNGTLAYESGDTIKVRALANGAERTIANAAGPKFSADGAQLFLSSERAIASQPAGGGASTQFAGPFDSGIEFDIAADKLAFTVITLRQFGAPGVPGAICTVTEPRYFERTGQEKFADENSLASGVALAPNKQWIAYRDAGFCNVAGTGVYSPARLCLARPADGAIKCTEGIDGSDPDFSPDGATLVFAAEIGGDQSEIWTAQIQADGSLANFAQLSRGPANQPSRQPAFSSDGNWVTFARDTDPGTGENLVLHVVRADGFGLRSLAVPGAEPDWLGGGGAPPVQGLSRQVRLPLVQK